MLEILGTKDIHVIADYLDGLVRTAAERLNKDFSPRRLAKAPRHVEPLPVERTQLSSYRTRIGTMLEYGLGSEVDALLAAEYGEGLSLTFAVAHEYPDFYLRNEQLTRILRIEMKAVDAGSDEQAARFSVPTAAITHSEDLLLFVGWQWADLTRGSTVIGEYPCIFATLVVPASDIVAERDVRLALTGGKISGERVLVQGRSGSFVDDPGNYGKLWRLVHQSRRDSEGLSASVQKLLEFLKEIDKRSPRSRF